jgi:hypothetical protein
MNREDIIRMAQESKLYSGKPRTPATGRMIEKRLKHFAELVAAAEREQWPNLNPVIQWLENGCDPKEAAKELRHYAAAIRARGGK